MRRTKTLGNIFGAFFPPACAGCDGYATSGQAFCTLCQSVATPLSPPFCACCQVPMQQLDHEYDAPSLCSQCRRQPPSFEQVEGCWEYSGAVADAIRRIKYGKDFPALRALCRGARPWFFQQLGEIPDSVPIFIIPAHRSELRRRGFHLPSLALSLLQQSRRQHRIDGRLKKIRATAPQASLPFGDRRKNVRRAFRFTGPAVNSKTAILFDDVLTTGATADAAACQLRDAGFDEIRVFVLARAPNYRIL